MDVTDWFDELERRYQLFNRQDLSGLAEYFAADSTYTQLNTTVTFTGRDQIQGALEGWRGSFEGARVADVTVAALEERTHEVSGAVGCFQVNFTGLGKYVQVIPGLEGAPATEDEVRLPVIEVVWLDADGQFMRVENEISVDALRKN